MTATGNEAVSVAQLKDYAGNQSAGSGSGYTYKIARLSKSSSKFGKWTLRGGAGPYLSDPIVAICYNDSELVLECVSTVADTGTWNLTVTNNAGTVHFLGVARSSEESYPMFIAVPYTAYSDDTDITGTGKMEISKSGNTLSVRPTFSQNGQWLIASTHLRFYVA